MQIELCRLDDSQVIGIYATKADPQKRHLPERMRWLAPEAARSYVLNLSSKIVVSDMLRTAESSLQAVQEGRGAKMPGYSGHGYGFSIDVDVNTTMKLLGFKTKRQLDDWMATFGWFCHRIDHKRAKEDWHFNFFGPDGFWRWVKAGDTRTEHGLERMITATYGANWVGMDSAEIQSRLKLLKLYNGAIDGKFGPLSKAALAAFQRTWKLLDDGIPGPMTKRVLAFVTAERHEVPLQ